MAHKGVVYRIAFRRDFDTNRDTYAQGNAHAYDFTFYDFVNDPHHVLKGLVLRPVELPVPGGNVYTWRSAFVARGAFRFRCTMVLTVTVGNSTSTRVIHVEEFTLGDILRFTTESIQPQFSIWHPLVPQIMVYFNPAYFNAGTPLPFTTLEHVKYADE
jgi:hypothetical protein